MIFVWKTPIAMLLVVYSLQSKANPCKGISYSLPVQRMGDTSKRTFTSILRLIVVSKHPFEGVHFEPSQADFWLLH